MLVIMLCFSNGGEELVSLTCFLLHQILKTSLSPALLTGGREVFLVFWLVLFSQPYAVRASTEANIKSLDVF